jgi:hypothetical protein
MLEAVHMISKLEKLTVLGLAVLVHLATITPPVRAQNSATSSVVFTGLVGKAHYRVQQANKELDTAVANFGTTYSDLKRKFERAVHTCVELSRDMRTAFGLAAFAPGIQVPIQTPGLPVGAQAGLEPVGFYNTAVEEIKGLISRCQNMTESFTFGPTEEELQVYRTLLSAALLTMEDNRGNSKKLGAPVTN